MEWNAKCLEVSGKISTFAFDGSNDRAPAFLRLTRTSIFVRGATHVVTCQLETGTALQATSPIDCVRGCFARCHSMNRRPCASLF